jgi:hypothetical protein
VKTIPGGAQDLTGSKWHRPTIATAVVFSGFSAVHLIDDFLADVPREFHLTVEVTELLALGYMIALIGLIAAAAAYSRAGYAGLAIAGLLISIAQLAKSVPEILLPGQWRAGLSSELLAVGLTASATLTMITSFLAWRDDGTLGGDHLSEVS